MNQGWGPPGQGYGYPPQQQQGPVGYGYGPGPMVVYGPPPLPVGCVRCPFCAWTGVPIKNKKTTTGGWVLFAILLIFFFPLCWIGILIRETKHRCGSCLGIISER
jgi:hypothetical protein